ncbi:MAG: hypothetical protein NT042_03695 [Sulfuritalea sp.]|nr:hypothetical protein [Sulfuritalea sp.]
MKTTEPISIIQIAALNKGTCSSRISSGWSSMGERKPENRVLSRLSMSAFRTNRFMVDPKLKAFLDVRQPGLLQCATKWRPEDRAFSFSI